MRSAILPFWPVLRDFVRNIWYLRLFIIVILITMLASSGILALAEGKNIDPNGTAACLWSRSFTITLNDVFFGLATRYSPVTFFGKAASILNSFIGYILLGVLIWVVEQSLSDHQLKKSRYLIFPTRKDFERTT
jgi:hypothetical protein